MFGKTRSLIAASVAMCLACCANSPAQTKPPASAPGDGWRLTFRLSGGFAGFDRKLELDNVGRVTATDRRIGTKTTKATAKELGAITSLIEDLKPMNRSRDTGCRDCIQYSLAVLKNGQTTTLQFDDTALRDSKIQGLVEALTSLLNRALTV
jgi:hypothetical protein